MKTIIDSSVWSNFFRKKSRNETDERIARKIQELAVNNEIVIIGAIRQESLSGIASEEKFEKIKSVLSIYTDFPVTTDDYVTAARFFNTCRSHGVQGSHIDFLISAVAANNNFSILSLDNDFERYRKFVKIELLVI